MAQSLQLSRDTSRLRVAHIGPAYGGVANAASRLHLGLLRIGIESRLFLPHSHRIDPNLKNTEVLSAPNSLLHLADAPSKLMYRYFGVSGVLHMSSLFWRFSEFDVIHLHGGDASWFNFHALGQWTRHHTLVWTMHDKHLGTGACGYPEFWECQRWQTGCGRCPKAKSNGWPLDFTHFVFARKQRILNSVQMAVVAPNRWMLDFIAASPITRHQNLKLIPYGVDVEVFTPLPAAQCRSELGLPATGRLLLTVATRLGQTRKGMQYYPSLLSHMREYFQGEEIGLVLVGAELPETMVNELNAILPTYTLGRIDNVNTLAKVYSAVDFLLVTSIIDNFPNVILESMACGTPTAGFNVGGIPDMILPLQTGVLADLGDTQALAAQLSSLLRDGAKLAEMHSSCRNQAVSEYSLEMQAAQYVELYTDLVREKALP